MRHPSHQSLSARVAAGIGAMWGIRSKERVPKVFCSIRRVMSRGRDAASV